MTNDTRTRAEALLRTAVVWDNHGCMPLRCDESFLPQLERYRCSGVTIASLNIGFANIPWTEQLRVVSYMRRWISLRPQSYRLVSHVSDIRLCKRDGRLGVVFDIEGMGPVTDDLSLVQTFYDLGVRWMLIAYNKNNAAGGGCMDTDGGLTCLGRAIIDEMERVGMVLCLSHTGHKTVAEALDFARNPPIFSHSNPYGHTAHERNITNHLMTTCARKGGVIGLSGIAPYLGGNDRLIERWLSQLRYVIDLVGADHVGIGLDYVFDRTELDEYVRSNPALFPPGVTGGLQMIEPENTGAIAEGLARDNLSDTQISGILGGNWMRIAERVWR